MHGEHRRRRGRTSGSENNNSAKGSCNAVKYIAGAALVLWILCTFLLLTMHHGESDGDPGALKRLLFLHLGMQESNITALISQQQHLSALTARLSQNLQREHEAMAQLKERVDTETPVYSPQAVHQGGSSDNSVAMYAGELRRQREEIDQLYKVVSDLRASIADLDRRQTDGRMSRDQLPYQNRAPELTRNGNSYREPYDDPRYNDPRYNTQPQRVGQQAMPKQHPQPQPRPYVPPAPSPETPRPMPRPEVIAGNRGRVFPSRWLQRYSQQELEDSANEADHWLELTKNIFRHTWRGYQRGAWGKDELRPDSGAPGRTWANVGLQILDSLSTLWLMGFREEFEEAARWVEHSLKFDYANLVSTFEITIRALGGLCSAHSLSGKEVFLHRARELADKLLPTFNSDTGFPRTQVNLRTGEAKPGWYQGTVLAEAGSVQLEFRYVSQQTGDNKYQSKADGSMRSILKAANGRGLVPWGLSKNGKPRYMNSHITFGAMGDSYYEYLLKMYLQTGKVENEWKEVWKKAMQEMMSQLIQRTRGGLTYIAEMNGGRINHKMDHLACFVGGMLVLGARMLPQGEVDSKWEPTAAGITETCYQMYHRQPSHLSPECVRLDPHGGPGQEMRPWNNAHHYLLRPEAAEAIFYMFYFTGDPKYRRMAGEIVEAIEKHCRAEHGYSAVADVRQEHPRHKNEMETFFLAETVKYLYLTFVPNPHEVINLDEWVFTTEAHPIRIRKDASSPQGSTGGGGGFLGLR
mmetsp:Transcript_157299/g.293448  ORF Transcript_157299/g.293448 Transcript_157299/m.293448 type:complete len:750 (+) Transcript_157299:33-2282(+)